MVLAVLTLREFVGKRGALGILWMFCALGAAGCGGSHAEMNAPVVLSVSVNVSPIVIAAGETVYVPVTVVAPTESVSFAIRGLPGGVSASYKESESNPSGQLTLAANSSTVAGTYSCTITVGSSGQIASTTVPLDVTAPKS